MPDDELMLREHHSTLEIFRKYEAIFWFSEANGGGIELVSLTDYFARGEPCAPDACLFFAGLPCMDDLPLPQTRTQCEELLRTRRTVPFDDSTVTAAPFVLCSIYTGRMKEQLCDPMTKARELVVYRVEG